MTLTERLLGEILLERPEWHAIRVASKANPCRSSRAPRRAQRATRHARARPTCDRRACDRRAAGRPGRLTAASIHEQANATLHALGKTRLELYYLHAPDAQTPIEESLEAINALHVQGKIVEFGLSNYSAWQVAEICAICDARAWLKPTVYQGVCVDAMSTRGLTWRASASQACTTPWRAASNPNSSPACGASACASTRTTAQRVDC